MHLKENLGKPRLTRSSQDRSKPPRGLKLTPRHRCTPSEGHDSACSTRGPCSLEVGVGRILQAVDSWADAWGRD